MRWSEKSTWGFFSKAKIGWVASFFKSASAWPCGDRKIFSFKESCKIGSTLPSKEWKIIMSPMFQLSMVSSKSPRRGDPSGGFWLVSLRGVWWSCETCRIFPRPQDKNESSSRKGERSRKAAANYCPRGSSCTSRLSAEIKSGKEKFSCEANNARIIPRKLAAKIGISKPPCKGWAITTA